MRFFRVVWFTMIVHRRCWLLRRAGSQTLCCLKHPAEGIDLLTGRVVKL